jgi:DNA-binding NtrC family response regulator
VPEVPPETVDEPGPTGQPSPPGPKVLPWILIVMSDAAERQKARKVWEEAGFAVEMALNVDDALECLAVMTPSLVVLDDRLYRPDGR